MRTCFCLKFIFSPVCEYLNYYNNISMIIGLFQKKSKQEGGEGWLRIYFFEKNPLNF